MKGADVDVEDLKTAVCAEVDRLADQLLHASHEIHAHPELNFAEHFAHDLLVDQLRSGGLQPTAHAYGVDTAFEASVGESGFNVAVLCEYDALPAIGHACGHNVIATAGLGAGLAAATVAAQAGGTLRIMGTPAEEGGGGKIELARRGAFKDVDAAMMVHPADADLIAMDCIALQELHVQFHGKAAHAAAAPWEGRNALDAAVLGYMNVAALRQHIRPTERVHGIITKGGDKANIVPSETAMEWIVRSGTIESLQPLKHRVLTSLESAATACACSVDHEWHGHTYAEMIDNGPMVAAYVKNSARVGRNVVDPAAVGRRVVGSTDMGNISYLVPSIHPMIKVAPAHLSIHTPEFAEYTASADGDQAVIDGAKAMAMTVADLWLQPDLLARAQAEFADSVAERRR
jgi:amidohydrolase